MKNSDFNSRGFTLVEVMVALAVVAVALPALMFSLHQQIDGTGYLRDKSIAHIIAVNKLTEVRLLVKARGQLLKGKDSGTSNMAGREWNWKISRTETDLPNFFRVEIKIQAPDSEGENSIYTLVGFLSGDLRPGETPNAQGG